MENKMNGIHKGRMMEAEPSFMPLDYFYVISIIILLFAL